MQREYLILMQGEKSLGAVKLEMQESHLVAEVTVEASVVLSPEEVLKAYLVMPQTGEVRGLGVLEDHREQFELKNTTAPIGIAVTIKNTATGKESYLCHCAEEGKLEEVKKCFSAPEKQEPAPVEKKEIIQEQKEEPLKPTPAKKTEEKTEFTVEYLRSAEEKLEQLTSEYETEKINGYFLKSKSRILEYVMGGQDIYRRIMRYGFYFFARKQNGEDEEFIIAVPSAKNEGNPFKNCEKYAFKLESDMVDEIGYYCVAAGKDRQGEFFKKISQKP